MRWFILGTTAIITMSFLGCGGGSNRYSIVPPPIKIKLPIVEFPEHGLDFSVVTDKKVYFVGEPVTFSMKVKNSDSKPHTLTFKPCEDNESLKGVLCWYHLEGPTFRNTVLAFGQTFTVTVQPQSEVILEPFTTIWKQDEEVLKETVGIGSYGIAPYILGLSELDGEKPPPVHLGDGTFWNVVAMGGAHANRWVWPTSLYHQPNSYY